MSLSPFNQSPNPSTCLWTYICLSLFTLSIHPSVFHLFLHLLADLDLSLLTYLFSLSFSLLHRTCMLDCFSQEERSLFRVSWSKEEGWNTSRKDLERMQPRNYSHLDVLAHRACSWESSSLHPPSLEARRRHSEAVPKNTQDEEPRGWKHKKNKREREKKCCPLYLCMSMMRDAHIPPSEGNFFRLVQEEKKKRRFDERRQPQLAIVRLDSMKAEEEIQRKEERKRRRERRRERRGR